MDLKQRIYPASTAFSLVKAGTPPLLARILAARGITSPDELSGDLRRLHHHSLLKGSAEAASYLADCIKTRTPILVIADYDCDGATACAVAVRGLRAFGAVVDYLVPDRMIHGYGLTPSVVELACQREPRPKVLLTVDNGIASHAGVDRAVELGLEVVVTDHHLPSKAKALPAARIVVDPAQEGCAFPTKSLAGCGVIWYVLWALQDELRRRAMPIAEGFKVSSLLPLVAMGTVADVVTLDGNNRVLVQAGLTRIREGASFPGIDALAEAGQFSQCNPRAMITTDIAFGLGPRINAAGRLESMKQGIDCLLSDDLVAAETMAAQLDALNQERREIEYDIIAEAVKQASAQVIEGNSTIVVHEPEWRAGVIGIVAGRLKEKRYRPTFVLCTDDSGQVKGSGRSIPGFNLKDALDQVDKAHPGLMVKFGGHAMAAGLTIRAGGVTDFQQAFEAEARRVLTPSLLNQVLEHDGSLPGQDLSVKTARLLRDVPWGQGFPEPAFCDEFEVLEAKIVGAFKDQLNMVVAKDGQEYQATRFRHEGPVPTGTVTLIYKLSLGHNKFGKDTLKLLVEATYP